MDTDLVLVGLAFMAYGLFDLVRVVRLQRRGVSTQARIARVTYDSEGRCMPVIEFWTQGAMHCFKARSGYGLFSNPQVGDSVASAIPIADRATSSSTAFAAGSRAPRARC